MKRIVLLLSVIVLHGCSGVEPKPVIETVYVKVNVPGPAVPCKVPMVDKPADLVMNLKTLDDIYYKSKVILADRELHKAYELKLETAIKTCNQSD